MARGALIAIEGIDGTGKGTQARMLMDALARAGRKAQLFSFPSYSKTLAGSLVGAYLDGEMGDPRAIDSRLTAVLYALDRFENKKEMDQALARWRVVVCDRYVGSNLAHQVARAPAARRRAVRELIEKLEFEVLGLPRPDLVVCLDMPAALAQQRVLGKAARDYTKKQLDVQEADSEHLRLALAEYRLQARRNPNWVTVPTVRRGGAPRSREEIHADVLRALAEAGIVRTV
ncbi:MAG: dTMP kinase [Myxococcales bacterium]